MNRIERVLVLSAFCAAGCIAAMAQKPIPVKVVVVAMFEVGADTGDTPGELQYWVERDRLDRVYPLPAGYHAVRMNNAGEMAVLTGPGTAHAAATIMALGLDPRFDLTHAYWLDCRDFRRQPGTDFAGLGGVGAMGGGWRAWLRDRCAGDSAGLERGQVAAAENAPV